MIKFLRTYRFLRVLVAVAALLSIGLPLARHACAMTGLTMAAQSTMPPKSCPEHPSEDRSAMAMPAMEMCAQETSPLCPKDSPCAASKACSSEAEETDADPCCRFETADTEKIAATESKIAPAKIVLPLSDLLTSFQAGPKSPLSISRQETALSDGRGVPIRVLHASFLL